MDISLPTQITAPLPPSVIGNGAAHTSPTAQTRQNELPQHTATPMQLGIVGAVNEALISGLAPNKPEPALLDRTLKPYDTVMLPHSLSDANRLQKLA